MRKNDSGEPCLLLVSAKYSFCQLKWTVINQSAMHDDYARGKINEELDEISAEAEEFSKNYTVVCYSDREAEEMELPFD